MPRKRDSRFDPWRLAASSGVLEGAVDPASLPRLAERVVEGAGEVAWRIVGTTDEQGRPAVRVELDGRMPLQCQRCLGIVEVEVRQRTGLLLARTEQELGDLDGESELEVTLADGPLEPLTLVEDELLLTLPYAPRHEGRCPEA